MQQPRLQTAGNLPSKCCHSQSRRFVNSFLFSRLALSPACLYILSLASTSWRRSQLASTLRLPEQMSHHAICCISPIMALQSWQSSRQVSFSVRQRGKSHSFISSFFQCICNSLSNLLLRTSQSSGPSRPISYLVSIYDDILLRCSFSYVELPIAFKYLKRSPTKIHTASTPPPTQLINIMFKLFRKVQAANPHRTATKKRLINSSLELRKRRDSESLSFCCFKRFFQFSASLMVLRMEENLDSQVLRPRQKKRAKIMAASAGRKY